MSKRSILVVDDDRSVRSYLSDFLTSCGYSVECAESGDQAVARLSAGYVPSLIILDIVMPGINGIELYDRLQQKEETQGVPAIMMSATLPADELQSRGIHQLRKPMDIGNVIRMITHALATSDERHMYG